jgi:arylsulfatase A-like enzyme
MPQRAVVITFDRLHIGYLGCYGNDWVETPNFDRLATESVLFDHHLARTLGQHAGESTWWETETACADATGRPQLSLPESLSRSGVASWLFAESDGRDSPGVAPPFDDVTVVRGTDSLDAAEDQPPFARLVQMVIERLPGIAASSTPTLVWIRSRGVPAPWLPPEPFADLYLAEFGLDAADESDPDSEDGREVEEQSAGSPAAKPATADAVIELKFARALYAAYVTWLDRWLGKLLRTLEKSPGWNETLLIVTAASGQSLGERGPLDEQALPLRAELIHTPLFVRLPDKQHDATRRAELVQTIDIAPTLRDWFGIGASEGGTAGAAGTLPGMSLLPIVRQEPASPREFAYLESDDEQAIRTAASLFVQHRPGSSSGTTSAEERLFEKPTDRWDMADVASQDPRECDRLRDMLRTLQTGPASA